MRQGSKYEAMSMIARRLARRPRVGPKRFGPGLGLACRVALASINIFLSICYVIILTH